MLHHSRLAAAAAGVVLAAATGAAAPASAAPGAPPAAATALVTDARWGSHCSFDRIVIDVRGKLPPVTVRTVGTLRYDGPGTHVPLAGKHFLEIRLSPAAAHDDGGKSVYRGPRLARTHLPALRGLALTGDFEGAVTLGAAFRTEPAYSTHRLHAPERFVVDVRHPSTCGR
ncbi:hypothetical protein [Streptomyces sp. B1I3]|uniref:AMIN-like domain-containing (lipo)protein n=1 Tax=Streptomyces sp. B1I3 TaxID=3042264 RepID=UPI00278B7A8C|nr:hypothetical protein [Streptomyces sp. B1I3]MDQ0791869.1 hypothetical protein [Streptomyces sp. B1I3]